MPSSMKLAEFSDEDLVFAFDEAMNDKGEATAADVAEQIGITHDHPNNCVGGRFAYLKRIGIMGNRRENGETIWFLTDAGEQLTHPRKLPVAAERAIAGMDEGQRIAATNAMASTVGGLSSEAAQLARRAWRHHTTPTPA